jgi:hypothetical protein
MQQTAVRHHSQDCNPAIHKQQVAAHVRMRLGMPKHVFSETTSS